MYIARGQRGLLSSSAVWGLSLGLLCGLDLGCSNDPQSLSNTPDPTGNAGAATNIGGGGSQGDNKAQTGGSDAGVGAGGTAQGGGDSSTPTDASNTDPNTDPNADPFATPPALRGAVTLSDSDLASQALSVLGNTCSGCHQLGRPILTQFADDTNAFATACLGTSDLKDQAAVDALWACVRTQSGVPASPYNPHALGIYAAAARLPWFSFIFQHATGASTADAASFVSKAGMPLTGQPLTQAQFDLVAEWFARGVPNLYDLVPADPGEACVPSLAPELGTYINGMATAGWRAKNAEALLPMYGCASGQSGSACLSTLPAGTDWVVAGSQIRILRDNSASHTTYWSRSSADGRFIGSGLRDATSDGAGQFVDLQANRTIVGAFDYDATFFPDNSGFLVQRGGYDDGSDNGPSNGHAFPQAVAVVCPQSVIESDPATVSGTTQEGCSLIDGTFGLYQQPGKAVDGGDYWVVFGSYQSDNGGFDPTLQDPLAAFDAQSNVTLTPMINQGNAFVAGSGSNVVTPHQGDPVLSPSGGLLVTRTKDAVPDGGVDHGYQGGYALYRVSATGSPGNETATLHDVGHVCLQGSKATFSYDERWMVFHHYVTANDATELGFTGPNDPDFANYKTSGSSNLYLVDLTTGMSQRITNMPAGQYALFPHFRSDGWIYFVVRSTTDDSEYFAASDAALVSEAH